MDFRTLSLFRQLAQTLHYGRTAELMHVTPSALTRAIQRLEQECGVALLQRDNRNVRLTSHGLELLDFCQSTLAGWQQLKTGFRHQGPTLQGELRLFCSVTASYSHAPKIVAAFRQQFPQVELKLTTGDPALAIDMVKSRQADMAVAVIASDFPSSMQYRYLDTLPLGLISPLSMHLHDGAQLDWSRLQLILAETGPSRELVDSWFAQHMIRPRIYAQVAGHEAIVSMVALGCGVGIVPRVVVDHSVAASQIDYLALDGLGSFKLGLCFLREREQEPLIAAMLQTQLQTVAVS